MGTIKLSNGLSVQGVSIDSSGETTIQIAVERQPVRTTALLSIEDRHKLTGVRKSLEEYSQNNDLINAMRCILDVLIKS